MNKFSELFNKDASPDFIKKMTNLRLAENKLRFHILGISESRLKSDKIRIASTYLLEYNTERTPAESCIYYYI